MRVVMPLAGFLLAAAVAQAQQTAPVTPAPQGATPQEMNTPPATAPAHRPRMSLQERFDSANTTHDGHLTPEQAQAHWPGLARHFAEIDTNHRGYVTVDDIRAYRKAHPWHRKGTAASTATQQQ